MRVILLFWAVLLPIVPAATHHHWLYPWPVRVNCPFTASPCPPGPIPGH